MDFKIIQWNINGLINNYHELLLLIKDHNPDIISIQETNIPYNSINLIYPKHYNGFFHNLSTNITAKQGIAILVKNTIPHKLIYTDPNTASIAIEIDIGLKFTFINTYIPPNQDVSESNLKRILNKTNPPVFLTGDFNSWSTLWGSATSNSRGKILENFILNEDLIILNNGNPTHFSTHNSFTHIDVSLCSPHLAPFCSWATLSDLHGSDHYPILIKIEKCVDNIQTKYKPKYKTEAANWNLYQNHCDNNLCKAKTSNNINQQAASIKKIIRSAANVSIPQTKKRVYRPRVVWWNANLEKLRTQKQDLWHNFKRNRTDTNLILYKKQNAMFRRAVKDSKAACIQKFTSNINPTSSSQRIWSDIKLITGGKRSNSIRYLKSGLNTISSPIDIANCFANHWSTLSEDTNFSSIFQQNKENISNHIYNPKSCNSFAIKIESPINMMELEDALHSAKGKTPGDDRISYPMLKNMSISTKKYLLSIYNNIFSSNVYPQSWKIAAVVPIPKPNKDPYSVNGYRPISLLPCISKTLEKIISRRIMWFLKAKNLITSNQVAFMKKQGTDDVLLYLQHFISRALSSRNHVNILSTDFERAFDRIGVHVILQQLSEWKIGKNMYSIIKSFLSNRKFNVRINGHQSNTFPLHNGIPQGSPLSVVLFVIAFNQFSKIINTQKHIEHAIYADDAVIFTKTKDNNKVKEIFSKLLKDIENWTVISGAKLSIEKCNLLHICKKQNCNLFDLEYNNIQIQRVDNLRILGVVFDKSFTFREHCLQLRKNLNSRLNIIKYLTSKHFMIHISTMINITRCLVLSKIDYALPIYGWCAPSNLNLIKAPYHAAIRRSIGALRTSPIPNILAEAGMPSVETRTSLLTHKLIPKLFSCHNKILYQEVSKAINHKRIPRIESTVVKCINFARKLDLHLYPIHHKQTSEPPWSIKKSSFILSMVDLPKTTTPSMVYIQTFYNIVDQLTRHNWTLLFTDGSKSTDSTTFATVQQDGKLITSGYIDNHCSNFTAEAMAILCAAQFAEQTQSKYIICSDSLSSISATQNSLHNSPLINQIRNILNKNPEKIKLMWVPSHVGIPGNEYADAAATEAKRRPLIKHPTWEYRDIINIIYAYFESMRAQKWTEYQHLYKKVNPHGKKVIYPKSCSRNETRTMVRLRIGHCNFSHKHLLEKTAAPRCTTCNSQLTVTHILDECTAYSSSRINIFGNIVPSDLLENICDNNIKLICKFILENSLQKII